MRHNRITTGLALALTSALVTLDASPCMHYRRSYRVNYFEEGTKKVLLFHDGTNAHVVLRTDLRVPGVRYETRPMYSRYSRYGRYSSYGRYGRYGRDSRSVPDVPKPKLPEEIAWVLPFPSLPSKFEEVKSSVFSELEKLYEPPKRTYVSTPRHTTYGSSRAPSGLEVHRAQAVGNYRIQPIEVTAAGAGEELNKWLEENKFNPMPKDLQERYLKVGAVFLAIRAKVDAGAISFNPLHIVYRSDELSFPLKFTHDTRRFDIDLYVRTKKKERPSLGWGFSSSTIDLRKALAPSPAEVLGKLLGKRRGYLHRYQGRSLNKEPYLLRDLRSDPTFTP